METIDMSQVAGFKAVDAEGNELGVVSMNELTESISKQVLQTIAMRNQATTLEQPALMSAASTLAAGNDAYENELPEQTDLKWARALDASGNPILISKESLASVVGVRLLFSFRRIQVPANGEIELGFLAGIFVAQLPSETHNLSMALLQNNNAGNVLVQYSRISYFNEGEYLTIYKKEEGGSWFAKNSTGGIIPINYSAIVLYQG